MLQGGSKRPKKIASILAEIMKATHMRAAFFCKQPVANILL